MFDPNLQIGQVLNNAEIVETFQCGNMGGMRRSKATNTLVLVSDYTKGLYHDKWIGGVLHYTGMGKSGDQKIDWAQNKTLAESQHNGVDVHLFEVIDAGEYIYCGRIELVDKPYTDSQPGEDGIERQVWMFPIRPVPDNDVKKPEMFVFSDMDDYKARGKNIDEEYIKTVTKKKTKSVPQQQKKTAAYRGPQSTPKTSKTVPAELIGQSVRHKTFGEGKIVDIQDAMIVVMFDTVGEKKMGYEFCIEKNLLTVIGR